MKNLKFVTILTLFLIGLSATSTSAQGRRRPEGSSGARAAYGYPTAEFSTKKKKQKKQKKRKAQKTKSAPLYRKKNPWAN